MKNLKRKNHIDQIDIAQLSEILYLSILATYFLRLFFDTALLSIPWPGRSTDFLRAADRRSLLKGRVFIGL